MGSPYQFGLRSSSLALFPGVLRSMYQIVARPHDSLSSPFQTAFPDKIPDHTIQTLDLGFRVNFETLGFRVNWDLECTLKLPTVNSELSTLNAPPNP